MSGLTFPNPSRSFDRSKNAVRFLGYDGMFQVSFFVQASALSGVSNAVTETECLAAFDNARKAIQDVASEVYSHGRNNFYLLTRADFR